MLGGIALRDQFEVELRIVGSSVVAVAAVPAGGMASELPDTVGH